MRFQKNTLLIGMFALSVGLVSGTAIADTIIVSSNSGGTGGACTIRDAITAANTDAVSGGCSAGSGDDVIALPVAATITLTVEDNLTDGSNGLPSVSSTITIDGKNSTIQRDAGLVCNQDDINDSAEFRIFHIAASGNLTVYNATISNGCAEGIQPEDRGGAVYVEGVFEISGGTVTGSSVTNDGGGIYADGAVTVSNGSVISNNVAIDDDGGGIHIGSGGTLTVSDSTIIGNHTEGSASGGAIHCRINSEIEILNSLVTDNWTQGTTSNGGAMRCSGDLFISNSTFSNNRTEGDSASGGAINARVGALMIIDSTFSNNRTEGNADGGALYVAGDTTIVNSTISGNSSNREGGGIYIRGVSSGTVSFDITHSTITANTVTGVDREGGGIYIFRDSVTLNSSIVADNSNLAGASDIEIEPTRGGSISGSYNIIGDTATAGGMADAVDNNIVGVLVADVIDPNLQINGGSTQTHALFEGSLAIDQIPVAANGCFTSITTDQRGLSRPSNAECDIGAFEADLTYDCESQPWLVSNEDDLRDATLCYNSHMVSGNYEISITQDINSSINSPSINNNNPSITLLFDGQGFAINAGFGVRPLEIVTGTTVIIENISFSIETP